MEFKTVAANNMVDMIQGRSSRMIVDETLTKEEQLFKIMGSIEKCFQQLEYSDAIVTDGDVVIVKYIPRDSYTLALGCYTVSLYVRHNDELRFLGYSGVCDMGVKLDNKTVRHGLDNIIYNMFEDAVMYQYEGEVYCADINTLRDMLED